MPQASHTVDSTGFVDNGGRTGDERSRTEFSGMRSTEIGGQNPVGTPGSGFPLPEPGVGSRVSKEASSSVAGAPSDATVAEAALEAMSRAYCERERGCGRLRDEQTAACLKSASKRFAPALERAGCPYSFDSAKVVACTSSLREAACDIPSARLARVEACSGSAMCLPQ